MPAEIADTLGWLTAAAAAIWLGFGCYLALIAVKQRGIASRLRQLEQLQNDDRD